MSAQQHSDSDHDVLQRRRRVRALLAGGLVLGLGASMTLAAWTDNVFASGSFSPGSWNMQGSTVSATDGFGEHPSSSPGTLDFQINPGSMYPGQVVYASYWVHLDGASTNDGQMWLRNVTHNNGPLASMLSFGIARQACGATPAALTYDWPSSAPVTGFTEVTAPTGTAPTGNAVTLTRGSGGNPGPAVGLCFRVTLANDEAAVRAAGTTPTTVTWQLAGESTA